MKKLESVIICEICGEMNLAVKRHFLLHRQFMEMPVLQLQQGFIRKMQEINLSFFSATHRHAPPKIN